MLTDQNGSVSHRHCHAGHPAAVGPEVSVVGRQWGKVRTWDMIKPLTLVKVVDEAANQPTCSLEFDERVVSDVRSAKGLWSACWSSELTHVTLGPWQVRSLRVPGGKLVKEVLPGEPAEVTGLRGMPQPGDPLMVRHRFCA